jgi:hypothetical protein
MKTWKIQIASAAALCITVGLAGCAETAKESGSAQPAPAVAPAPAAPPVSGVVREGTVSATATVAAIDQDTRQVELRRADGSMIKFRAGENVRNLAQVKVGDEVTASYYESLVYEVKKPGEVALGGAVAEGLQRSKLGEMPGGVAARVIVINAAIAAIDKPAGTVTLRGPSGDMTTIKARDPQKLDRVAVGDVVEITYTEAVAISVETPKK